MSQDPKGPTSESFKDAPDSFVTSFTTKFYEFPALQTKFNALYNQAGAKALQARALAEGFQPVSSSDKNGFFGATCTFKSNDGRTATFEWIMHSYDKPGSKDQAAVATVKMKAGDKSETYNFLLVAPNGDLENPREFTLDERNSVVAAQSFWTRFRNCVGARCGSACLQAIPQCLGGSWAAFLWCLVARCGGCVLRCAACATCNCRWWCRWAVGCCRD